MANLELLSNSVSESIVSKFYSLRYCTHIRGVNANHHYSLNRYINNLPFKQGPYRFDPGTGS